MAKSMLACRGNYNLIPNETTTIEPLAGARGISPTAALTPVVRSGAAHGIVLLMDYFFAPIIESFAAFATRNLSTVLAGI